MQIKSFQASLAHLKSGALLLAATLLWGCSSMPKTAAPAADQGVAAKSVRSKQAAPALPAAGSGRGGYYKDDGPGDNPPDDLDAIPDAEPKVEPYLARANRPYTVFGQTYTPVTAEVPLRQRGIGSWYGKKFHGQKTSSGELYDMYKMTAAHPTLPIPSYARVTNLLNGKQVIVRINDRGPFHSSRIMDLSYTAALKLGYLGKGSGELEIERLLPADIARIRSEKQQLAAVPAPAAPLLPAMAAQPAAGAHGADSGFYLQLGAYGQAYNAQSMRDQLAQSWSDTLQPIAVVQAGALYRLYSGPYANRGAAQQAAQKVQSSGAALPFIVQR
ncbi:septal ring lytic transglycosylase RlpA family protein [Herminiimonas sp. CN]|uniref:septal ring lytic transglycosylase RlpA family protein n=1 Tax=Herminiimonas sp. CN TaxID=1349818 RepID=UPI0004743A55|nr:septal ring lytic transglycosylase RlpA family protein [Herminiimonas sp. CN]